MTRDTSEGKIDYTLVLDGPMFERWAALMTRGAEKYTTKLDLTLSNWLAIIGECQCKSYVSTSNHLAVTGVEAVMKKAFDNVIQNSQKGNEKIVDSGQTVIVPANVLRAALMLHLEDTEQNSYHAGAYCHKTNPPIVTFADVHQAIEPYLSTTTTKQVFLEVFSANSATSLSVTSKTVSNYLTGHDSTCPARLWQVEGNHIIKPGVRNWMKASGEAELERFKQSAFRHFIQWMRGDTDEDHGAAVMFNINGAEYVKQALAHSNGGTSSKREVNDCGEVERGVGSTGSVQGFNQACLTWAPFSSSGRAYGEGYIPLYDTSIVYGGAFGGDLRRNQLQPSGEAGVEGPDVGSQVCACAYCTGSVQGEGNPHRTIGLDTSY